MRVEGTQFSLALLFGSGKTHGFSSVFRILTTARIMGAEA